MAGEQVLVVDDSPTILKVVQMVLSKAGYSVRVAADGEEGVRSAREQRPDVILLDFVMPKMNGYQMCRALAESEHLRDVPVVLMSAKGDQVGERFVKVMGIVDYITKPFSPDAITAVVDNTIAKYGPSQDAVPRAPLRMPVDVDDGGEGSGFEVTGFDVIETQEGSERDSTSRRTAETPDDGRRRLSLESLRDAIVSAVADELVGDEGADRIRKRLTDAVLEQVLREVGPRPDRSVVLEGDLLPVPLPQVLALLADQRQTGVLTVRRGEGRVDIFFHLGKVDFASAEGLGDDLLLGRFLVARESISRQDLDLFIQSRGTSTHLIGEQLVKLNYISEADLRAALSRQTAERIYEAMRWSGGRFSFRATIDLGALAESASLRLSVDGVLMEGLRRVDEWHLIEREMDNFEAVFLRNEELVKDLARAQLTREEQAVLELVTGKNNVKDIVRLSRISSFEVSKMLFRLMTTRLVRRRVAPVAV